MKRPVRQIRRGMSGMDVGYGMGGLGLHKRAADELLPLIWGEGN